MGHPGERIEPLQAEQGEGEKVGDKVARTMMGKLMLERESPLMLRVERLEVGRHGDDAVEDPERQRTADFAGLDEPDRPDAPDLRRALEDRRALVAEGSIRATNRPAATPSQSTTRMVGQPPACSISDGSG